MGNQGKAIKGVIIGMTVALTATYSAAGAVVVWILFASLSFVKGR